MRISGRKHLLCNDGRRAVLSRDGKGRSAFRQVLMQRSCYELADRPAPCLVAWASTRQKVLQQRLYRILPFALHGCRRSHRPLWMDRTGDARTCGSSIHLDRVALVNRDR
jgi:hypothetical protein